MKGKGSEGRDINVARRKVILAGEVYICRFLYSSVILNLILRVTGFTVLKLKLYRQEICLHAKFCHCPPYAPLLILTLPSFDISCDVFHEISRTSYSIGLSSCVSFSFCHTDFQLHVQLRPETLHWLHCSFSQSIQCIVRPLIERPHLPGEISMVLVCLYRGLKTSWNVIGAWPWVRRILIARALCRRSDFRPTRRTGVFGQKCRTSGYHCQDKFEVWIYFYFVFILFLGILLTLSVTFSKLACESMAKHINMTSVSG